MRISGKSSMFKAYTTRWILQWLTRTPQMLVVLVVTGYALRRRIFLDSRRVRATTDGFLFLPYWDAVCVCVFYWKKEGGGIVVVVGWFGGKDIFPVWMMERYVLYG